MALLRLLRNKGKKYLASRLEEFYSKIDDSTIVFINQPEPIGFGNAVLRAEPFVNNEPFLLHAGDDIVLSHNESHIRSLIDTFFKLKANTVFLVEEVKDPSKYGVVKGKMLEDGTYEVHEIIEKPAVPPTNLAVIAIYVLTPVIFDMLKKIEPDKSGEYQLADAIQKLIEERGNVYAVRLKEGKRVDIGTPEGYLNALLETFRFNRKLKC